MFDQAAIHIAAARKLDDAFLPIALHQCFGMRVAHGFAGASSNFSGPDGVSLCAIRKIKY
jgi:hypothetical protein